MIVKVRVRGVRFSSGLVSLVPFPYFLFFTLLLCFLPISHLRNASGLDGGGRKTGEAANLVRELTDKMFFVNKTKSLQSTFLHFWHRWWRWWWWTGLVGAARCLAATWVVSFSWGGIFSFCLFCRGRNSLFRQFTFSVYISIGRVK